MTFAEEEERIIEQMARAACLMQGDNPDEPDDCHPDDPGFDPLWRAWMFLAPEARRHYAFQKAMMEAIGE